MELHLRWLTAFCLSLVITAPAFALKPRKANEIKFETKKIILNKKTVVIEIAEADDQLERGLMFRKNLAKDHGMLFIFKSEQVLSFWMKNTLINLSIGYFDKNRKLIDIQEMKAVTSIIQTNLPTYPSRGLAMYALEMSEGWFDKNKVSTGLEFNFVK